MEVEPTRSKVFVREFERGDQEAVARIFRRGLMANYPPESDMYKIQDWYTQSKLESDMKDIFHSYKCSESKIGLDKLYGFWVAVHRETAEVVGCVGAMPFINPEKERTSSSPEGAQGGDNMVELIRMSVSEDFRELGIGRLLVDQLIEHARAQNCTGVILSTLKEMNVEGFYLRNGFREDHVNRIELSIADLETPYINILYFVREC